MTFKQTISAGAFLSAAMYLSGCGTDVAVVASEPTPALDVMPFDSEKASEGEGLYNSYCSVCHDDSNASNGERGTYSGKFGADTISPIKHSTYATPTAIDQDRMANYATGTMPTTNKTICDFDCQDKIQHFFYKTWTEERTTSSVAASSVASSAAPSSSSAASSSAQALVNFIGEIDSALAAQGKLEFEAKCVSCHGDFGGNDGATLTAGQYPIHNNRITYELNSMTFGTLEEVIEEQMPNGNAANCDVTCAIATSEYIRSWTYQDGSFAVPDFSSNGSSSAGSSSSVPSGPTQTEIDARVAAGKTLYENGSGNLCMTCHGADGSAVGFDNILDTMKSYSQVVSIIKNGEGLMPACSPSGNCAEQIADYVWVEFLGFSLTTDGGTKP